MVIHPFRLIILKIDFTAGLRAGTTLVDQYQLFLVCAVLFDVTSVNYRAFNDLNICSDGVSRHTVLAK
jgi:hypothetical protein